MLGKPQWRSKSLESRISSIKSEGIPNVNASSIAYLARYLFAGLFVLTAGLLLAKAIRDISGRMRRNLRPVAGHYLLVVEGQGAAARTVKPLPLFHTTILGRSRVCDIRLGTDTVGARHAIIYRFEGRWFIRPVRAALPLLLNGAEVRDPVPLADQDRITLGEVNLVYIQDEAAQELLAAERQRLYRDRGMLPTLGTWFWVNIFYGTLALLLLFLLQGDRLFLREPVFMLLAAVWVLFNLYHFLLPWLLDPLDRPAWLAMMLVAIFGMVMQIRFSGLSNRLREMDAERMANILGDIRIQGIALLAGLVLLPVVAVIARRSRLIELFVPVCFVLTPLLLIATLILGRGRDTHGASLWIRVGGISLQLTEFAKLTYLVVLAGFFKTRPDRRVQIGFAAWAAVIFFLIMLLPDLGSAMILMMVTLVVYVVMTSEYLTTLAILVAGSALGALAFALFPHVRARISGWTTLWTEVTPRNAQIVYGLQAIARGGLLGRGLANGSPEGIPLAASDMVFAVVCEEFGILVGLAIVVCYITIWLRGAKSTMTVRDGFTSSLILGIVTALFAEAAIVISGVTGLLPLTGATLPFVAAGGSSLLAKFIMMAIYLGLAARREEDVLWLQPTARGVPLMTEEDDSP